MSGRMDSSSGNGHETDDRDDEGEGRPADELDIPDGAGCVEIWDRLSESRNEE